jgi:alanyl-tRNA synthetase
MTSKEIRKKFIDFFKKKQHKFVDPISLIPENDPSLLFTNSGMVQFKEYFLGLSIPVAKRMVNYQPCFRTIDLEKVGTNDRTLTLFEMLGSWSVGDPASPDGYSPGGYWKEDAISFAWELLTKEFRFPKEKLWVTVFAGNRDVPADDESINYWKVFLPASRIIKLGSNDNFWIAGEVGPCGPSTEIYFDQGSNIGCREKDCQPGCDCDRFLEIWNAGVFMQYEKKLISNNKEQKSFEFIPLKIKSVDTGAGLERLAAVLQDKDSVFEIDLIKPIYDKIVSSISSQKGSSSKTFKSIRVVCDHIRASVFLAANGVVPTNKTQGYVMRRLLRRMIVHGWLLGLSEGFIIELANLVIDIMKDSYPNLLKDKKVILEIIGKEENNFTKTLERGIKELNKIFDKKPKIIQGKDVFLLYDSYGFPVELTTELAREKKIEVDHQSFDELMKEQQDRARSSQQFMDKSINPKLHTATHLLHQALNDVLGNHVQQAGSNVSGDELRFDFTHPEKLSDEEKEKIEDIINGQILKKLPVVCIETSVNEAKKLGAKALFGAKYTNKVKLYYIGKDISSAYSKELCGGPHVDNIGELGHFKIISEKSSSSGIRRIKAILE